MGADTPAMPRIVLVTGAAGQLGRAVCAAFRAAGDTVVAIDRDAAALQAVFGAADAALQTLATDLLADDAATACVRQVLERHGRIDVLCNLAGGFAMGPSVHETPRVDWERMFDLNCRTTLQMVQAVVPAMLARGRGAIVNVGAASAAHGAAGMAAYVASKAALLRITESMALELRDQGIRVNAVAPSILDTPANRAAMPGADASRWVAVDDLAAVIGFLASDAARAVHGATLPVVGRS